jgi:hypothetical protein
MQGEGRFDILITWVPQKLSKIMSRGGPAAVGNPGAEQCLAGAAATTNSN